MWKSIIRFSGSSHTGEKSHVTNEPSVVFIGSSSGVRNIVKKITIARLVFLPIPPQRFSFRRMLHILQTQSKLIKIFAKSVSSTDLIPTNYLTVIIMQTDFLFSPMRSFVKSFQSSNCIFCII